MVHLLKGQSYPSSKVCVKLWALLEALLEALGQCTDGPLLKCDYSLYRSLSSHISVD